MTSDAALPRKLLVLAARVAREAGTLIRRRPADLQVGTKSTPTDVVTSVDSAAESYIVRTLLAARPQDGVLGEEGAGVVGTSGVRWIVDPIDGTVNYLYDLPAYAVSIAAEHDGTVVAGAVLDVAADALYAASLGGGADRNGQPLRCSRARTLGQALIGTGFGYDAEVRRRQAELLTTVLPTVRDIRRFGSCALDLCAVAAGRLDGYYEQGPSLWDHAAGGLVAREAGARVAVWADGTVVASAPEIFPALNALLTSGLSGSAS